jgi:hypothetical protein
MITKSVVPVLVSVALAGAFVSTASAAIIASQTYEDPAGGDPRYSYSYGYADQGTTGAANAFIAGLGVGGSTALVGTFDFTAASGGFSGGGVGGGLGPFGPDLANAFVAPVVLQDLNFSIAAAVSGQLGETARVRIELKFEVPDDAIAPDPDDAFDVALTITTDIDLTSTLTVYNSNLADWVIRAGSEQLLNDFLPQLIQINMNVNAENGFFEFGNDAGNQVIVDNTVLEQVPEPAGASLLALGAVALVLRRRRH